MILFKWEFWKCAIVSKFVKTMEKYERANSVRNLASATF